MVVLTLTGRAIDWEARTLDPTMLVQWQPDYGSISKRYMASLRTCAHQDWMDIRAFRRFGTGITIIQPPYNTGVPASAGTHDFDACRDWWIPGVGWWTSQRFGRELGEGVWYRHPPLFGHHMHGFTLPIPEGKVRADDFATRVGIFVPGQLVDYYNHAFGLAGQHTPGSDKSWFPKNIDATVFKMSTYINMMREKNMEYKDWSRESKDAFKADIAAAVWGTKVKVRPKPGAKPVEVTARQALARAANGSVVTKNATEEILAAISATADADNT